MHVNGMIGSFILYSFVYISDETFTLFSRNSINVLKYKYQFRLEH